MISVSAVHPSNADSPSEMTEAGSSTRCNLVQFWNADGEIVFKIFAEKDNKICLFSINGDGKDYIFTKPRIPIRYICRVIASQRDEDDLDEEMKHQHIVHSWQTKLNGIAAK